MSLALGITDNCSLTPRKCDYSVIRKAEIFLRSYGPNSDKAVGTSATITTLLECAVWSTVCIMAGARTAEFPFRVLTFFMISKFILQSVVIHLAEWSVRLQWLEERHSVEHIRN
jgi:hypothetical protein